MTFTFDDLDAKIVAASEKNWNKRKGARVGDFVKLKNGDLRRFTHDWGDDIQTTIKGNVDVSFYFNVNGFMSFSGSLSSPVKKSSLALTDEVIEGSCWIFHHGLAGGGRAVQAKVKCRVFDEI